MKNMGLCLYIMSKSNSKNQPQTSKIQKKIAKHPFAGQDTQQGSFFTNLSILSILFQEPFLMLWPQVAFIMLFKQFTEPNS